jgi:two-component system chemotaxis response regulator CheY
LYIIYIPGFQRGGVLRVTKLRIPMKVLIVDDNTLTRAMIKDLITEMGQQVVTEAENGDEAVKAYSKARPDLVLMDLIMPGKSGLDALKEIKAMDPSAKVIMVTAVQQDSISRQLLESGASGILHKPFMYSELEAVLKQYAGR